MKTQNNFLARLRKLFKRGNYLQKYDIYNEIAPYNLWTKFRNDVHSVQAQRKFGSKARERAVPFLAHPSL